MAMEQDVKRVERILDNLHGKDGDCIATDQIFKAAEQATLAPDMMYYFDKDKLKKDCYTREELVRYVNQTIKDRGRQQEVGLIH
jgi:hypothetical protein